MSRNDQIRCKVCFTCQAMGPAGTFGVFEDDGDTGYLYIYDINEHSILKHLHIYDRHAELPVQKNDVSVVWSSDRQKCGVIIWDKFRGIIDMAHDLEGRVWLKSRDTPGIADKKWLQGFVWATAM